MSASFVVLNRICPSCGEPIQEGDVLRAEAFSSGIVHGDCAAADA